MGQLHEWISDLIKRIKGVGIRKYLAQTLPHRDFEAWSEVNIRVLTGALEVLFGNSEVFVQMWKAIPLIRAVDGDKLTLRQGVIRWLADPRDYWVTELFGIPVITRSQLHKQVKIIKKLGEGDDGIVYLIETRSGKLRTLKRIHGRENADDYRRWTKEYLILDLLRDTPHPNIMGVYQAYFVTEDEWNTPVFYYVMDYVPGKPLCCDQDEACSQVVHADDLLPLTRQIVSALAFLHSHGVVHRDPDGCNIMWDAKTQHATLIDFGYACYVGFDGKWGGCDRGIVSPYYPDPSMLQKYKLPRHHTFQGKDLSPSDQMAEDVWIAGFQLYMWLEVCRKHRKCPTPALLMYKPYEEVFDYEAKYEERQPDLARIIASMLLPIDRRPTAAQILERLG